MLDNCKHFFYDIFIDWGVNASVATYLNMLALLIILALIVFITDYVTRKMLVNAFARFAQKTINQFDDHLVANKAPKYIAHIVPLIITIASLPVVFSDFQSFEQPVETLMKIYAVLLSIWIFRSVFNTFKDYFKTVPRLKDKPIDSYIQVFMLILWTIGIAFCFVILTGISILNFFTGLGAASAILLLVFKDSILGFVASIQVAANDTIRIGDWITMEKYGADGDVIEINLNTVQVQNFDKTITNIPTYALLQDAYTNWRGMSESGGRRLKRSILLKASSVGYLSNEQIGKLKKIELISDYLTERQAQIDKYNKENKIDKSVLINGRNMTNIGVFRKYINEYIQNHSAINKEMTIMVRQLAPTTQGLPLEIYAFSSDKRWENYEYIMADIFDHALGAVEYFDLEVFETASDSITVKQG